MDENKTPEQQVKEELKVQMEAIKKRQNIRFSKDFLGLCKAAEYEWLTSIEKEEIPYYPCPPHAILRAFGDNGKPIKGTFLVYRVKGRDNYIYHNRPLPYQQPILL